MTPSDHVAAARAVYDASADGYVGFVGTTISTATEGPVDRALLGAFVELVGTEPSGLVADIGCGPGRAAAFLAERGLDLIGVDVSEAMLGVARDAHPFIPFRIGQLDHLPFDDASLGGAVCWYSIIYTPPELLATVFAELRRVLNVGAHLLLAFQAGADETVVRRNAHGTPFSLTSVRHDVDAVAHGLDRAGFDVRVTVVREPEFDHESTPQAFVIARAS